MATLHELYQRYAADVYRFSFWISGNATEAEDLTSETFVRAFNGADGLRAETVKAYLFTIARNLFLQRKRHAKRQTAPGAGWGALRDRSPGPEARAQVADEVRVVLRALQELAEPDRAALLLRAKHGLSYEEISRALGMSLSAVKVRVHRARVKLASIHHDLEDSHERDTRSDDRPAPAVFRGRSQ